MPVWNAAEHLAGSVGSILSQRFRDFELIAVDDASDDESISVLKALAREDPRIRVESLHSQKGPAAARNFGLSLAQAPLVTFVDADDRANSDLLTELWKLLDRFNAEVSQCMVLREYAPGKARRSFSFKTRRAVLDPGEGLRHFLAEPGFPQIAPEVYAKMFRKSFLSENQIDFDERSELRSTEDLLFVQQCLLSGASLGVSSRELYRHKWNEQSITKDPDCIRLRMTALGTALALACKRLLRFQKSQNTGLSADELRIASEDNLRRFLEYALSCARVEKDRYNLRKAIKTQAEFVEKIIPNWEAMLTSWELV